jgi:hypothetical protein
MAIGLTAVLLVSGAAEAFINPSGLPTLVRVGIGTLAELLFLVYVFLIGRRAALAGESGDLEAADRSDGQPVAA